MPLMNNTFFDTIYSVMGPHESCNVIQSISKVVGVFLAMANIVLKKGTSGVVQRRKQGLPTEIAGDSH